MRSLAGLLSTIKQMRHEASGYVDPFTRQVAEKLLAELQTYVTDLADQDDVAHFDPARALSGDFAALGVRVRREDLESSRPDAYSVAYGNRLRWERHKSLQELIASGVPLEELPLTVGEYRERALARGDDPVEIERFITERMAYLAPIIRAIENEESS